MGLEELFDFLENRSGVLFSLTTGDRFAFVGSMISLQEQFLISWAVQKKWLDSETIASFVQSHKKRPDFGLKLFEDLLEQKYLSSDLFCKLLKKTEELLEWACSQCQKKFIAVSTDSAPKHCKYCQSILTVKPPFVLPPLVGTSIGQALISRKLGQGGMGSVYLAFHPQLHQWVALKILPKSLVLTPEEEHRFQLEAQSAYQLDHPNIVRVLSMGEEQGCHYMIQQFVAGPSLEKYLQEQKKLSIPEALPLMKELCRGLIYAHQQGIIHRDIKPSNIMLTPDLKPKITDFGLAKLLNSTQSISATGTIIGTPEYISPEQSEGKKVDHRTDIYSLGVTFFQMVTGHVPYEAESKMAILLKHLQAPVPNPSQICAGIDTQFSQIIVKCMAKKPEARFSNCQEILQILESYETGNFQSSLLPGILKTYSSLDPVSSSLLNAPPAFSLQATTSPRSALFPTEEKKPMISLTASALLFFGGVSIFLLILREILGHFLS